MTDPTPHTGTTWRIEDGLTATPAVGEPMTERDQGLLDRVERAIDSEDVLRQMVGDAVRIDVERGRVTLRGHVYNAAHRLRAEELARTVPGVVGVENQIVDDITLLQEVSLATTSDTAVRTLGLHVDTREGIVEISGTAPSSQAVDEIEATIAQVPEVRGIANHLDSPPVPDWWKKVIQPAVGAAVYATDREFGTVRAVIINPRSRRVEAIVVDGDFPPPGARPFREAPLVSGSVVIGMEDTLRVTPRVVFLRMHAGSAAGQRRFFTPAFAPPPDSWRPPFPYRHADVLFVRSSP